MSKNKIDPAAFSKAVETIKEPYAYPKHAALRSFVEIIAMESIAEYVKNLPKEEK